MLTLKYKLKETGFEMDNQQENVRLKKGQWEV